MFILMGIWDSNEPYSTPLDSSDTRGLDWGQADRRRPMFQVAIIGQEYRKWWGTNCTNRVERIMYHW
jgi:hypothetical protein